MKLSLRIVLWMDSPCLLRSLVDGRSSGGAGLEGSLARSRGKCSFLIGVMLHHFMIVRIFGASMCVVILPYYTQPIDESVMYSVGKGEAKQGLERCCS